MTKATKAPKATKAAKVEAPKITPAQTKAAKAAALVITPLLAKETEARWTIAEALHSVTVEKGGKVTEADRKAGRITVKVFCSDFMAAGLLAERSANDWRQVWTHFGNEAKRHAYPDGRSLTFNDHVALVKAGLTTKAKAERTAKAAAKAGRGISGQVQAKAREVQTKARSEAITATLPEAVVKAADNSTAAMLVKLAGLLSDDSTEVLRATKLVTTTKTDPAVIESLAIAFRAVAERATQVAERCDTNMAERKARAVDAKKAAEAQRKAEANSKSVAAERLASDKRKAAKAKAAA